MTFSWFSGQRVKSGNKGWKILWNAQENAVLRSGEERMLRGNRREGALLFSRVCHWLLFCGWECQHRQEEVLFSNLASRISRFSCSSEKHTAKLKLSSSEAEKCSRKARSILKKNLAHAVQGHELSLSTWIFVAPYFCSLYKHAAFWMDRNYVIKQMCLHFCAPSSQNPNLLLCDLV